jgi:hypothetical protein
MSSQSAAAISLGRYRSSLKIAKRMENPSRESGGLGGWGFHCRDGGATNYERCATTPSTSSFSCDLCRRREADVW